MPSRSAAARNNRKQEQRAKANLEKAFLNLRERALPAALDEIGKSAVAYTVATKQYQDRTGNLRSKHEYVVIPAGQSRAIAFEGKQGENKDIVYESGTNEVKLILYAKPFYALYVEIIHGLDVLIQGFLKIRREGAKQLGALLKGKKLF